MNSECSPSGDFVEFTTDPSHAENPTQYVAEQVAGHWLKLPADLLWQLVEDLPHGSSVYMRTKEMAELAASEVEQVYELADGKVVFSNNSLNITVEGKMARLSPTEHRLLLYLARHSGDVVLDTEIQMHMWPKRQVVNAQPALQWYITHLRKKLGQGKTARKDAVIERVKGAGYRLVTAIHGNESYPQDIQNKNLH
jgi:DNA-binding winged helix-turn-helix (wHTH) protein